MLYQRDKREFYIQYLATNRVPRPPQTQAMSVGSAFDYLVKERISSDLGIKFEMESGVEEHNQCFALDAGAKVLGAYVESDCYKRLIRTLERSSNVLMEKKIVKTIHGDHLLGEQVAQPTVVPLCGIPDLYFESDGLPVICDFKVNGYCSRVTTVTRPKRNWLYGPKSDFGSYCGIDYDPSCYLEDIDKQWALQLSVYAWLARGYASKQPVMAWIEQIVCNDSSGIVPYSNVHMISESFQQSQFLALCEAWNSITKGDIIPQEEASRLEEMCYGINNGDIYAKLSR
jgi:hypothetical protein